MSLSSPGHAVSLFRRQLFGKAFGSEVVVSLSSPGHAVSLFWSQRFWVRRRVFAGRDAQTQLKVQPVDLEAKSLFFRFWTQRLTLKITPTQVKKRCPWARQAMLFPCSGGSLFGKAFGSEVVVLPVVTPKRNGRCQRCSSKPLGGANWAPQLQKILFFYRFWTRRLTLKITPTQVEKWCHWARQAMLFPCSGGSLFGKAFGSEVVVLQVVTPKRNWRCKRWISKPNPHFLWVLDATFDCEDHPNTGQKTVSLSSPGHAVSLFRRQPFREGFWVRSRGFAGRDAQTQLKVQTVDLEAKSPFFIGSGRNVWHWRSPQHRSKNGVLELARPCCFAVLKPAFLGRLLGQTSCFCRSWRPNAIEGANGGSRSQIPIFLGSGRNVWHWRSPQHRSKNGVLELARPCCFAVLKPAFLGRLLGQTLCFCRSWRPNATEGANGVVRSQLEVQIEPHSCKKFSFFYRFWTRRLTLKITPTQVKKRCPWARQAMLFPCSGGTPQKGSAASGR